ncbi:MAG: efflux RND transporter periplasmic adaptor subunit [Rhodospirillaceae bacterium]|nr:MAG: efflux RND transporter periplasmic adaptor subunit [Rhodospirillaceae bacterium]
MASAQTLPRDAQIRIVSGVGIVALMLVFGIVSVDALRSYLSERSRSAVEPLAPGTFKPTAAQLAALTIKPVLAMTFRAQQITDGNIAIDDDLSTPVFSPYSGRVTKLTAKLGDFVEKDAPLLAIEASELVQAQNDLINAHAQFNLAATNEKRQHELYAAQGAALRDWQQSQADLAIARATLETVRNRLRIFGKTEAEIAVLENAPASRAMSPEAVITAPIAGRVLQRQVGLGQYIQSGAANPIYVIGNLSRVWLIANVRESDSGAMRVGQAVEVRVPAYPDRVFKASLTYVAPSIDPVTHRLPVRADIENADGALKPQMFASFSIMTGDDVNAPAVPQSAIVYDGDTARVWVAQNDGSLGLRPIRTGRVAGGMVEVIDGLSAADKVVTSGTLFIDRAAQTG